MGTIIAAHCECGYTEELLFIGCGMAKPNTCSDLARCGRCKTLVTVRTHSVRRRCPKCRRAVVGLDVPQDANGNIEGTTQCPRCGNESLRLSEAGMWD